MEIFAALICAINLGCGGLGAPSLMMMICFFAAFGFLRLCPPLPAPFTAQSQAVAEAGHIAGRQALEGGDDFRAIPLGPQLKIPAAPPHAAAALAAIPAKADHANIILRRERLDGLDPALLPPVIAIGHLAT